MVYLWYIFDHLWYIYAISMVYVWYVYGICMVCVWDMVDVMGWNVMGWNGIYIYIHQYIPVYLKVGIPVYGIPIIWQNFRNPLELVVFT
jgi:hypothetical protein